MVELVQPASLGNYEDFQGKYEEKIVNGQFKDASPELQKDAKSAAANLHKLTDIYIHRIGCEVLKPLIPKKQEHVFCLYKTHTDTKKSVQRKYLVLIRNI